jgi:two-component system LytT family response regulator
VNTDRDPPELTAVIADDEPLARGRILELLKRHASVRVVTQCATGTATIEAVRELSPDLLFLDVQMPGLNGFEVLAALRPEERPVVIFSTAYDEYALAAFEVHAVDYLLKPYADERFDQALRRAERAVHAERLTQWHDRLQSFLTDVGAGSRARAGEPVAQGDCLARFAVRTGDRFTVIEAARVDWIEAARDYVRLHVGGEIHLIRAAMAKLEQRLDPVRFLRIHRSTIVQCSRIRELFPDQHGDYVAVLEGGTRLRVSRRYREEALRRLGVQQ